MSGTFPQNGSSIPAITGEIDHKHAIHVFPERLQPLRSSIIAYAASLASTLVGYPMDTVKVHTAKSLAQKNMITSMLRKQLGLDKDLIHIAKTGLSQRKSYRGLGIAIARSFITNMVFFGVFELSMMHFI
ncbi:hypothetical protein KGF56_002731 [Candida oxycetoniae]|uniref:Mitochondrial thiamine pyrophosphate carrier 1 n=1 Tax=Candida oxycetoniae TaxID=497107 RepID=A0AAI9SX10_9ASCO|nr:uncharacterized protein KGF56_002731 [Candida oxycetoniae]KAI3404434.1 hypothetical protein KGF56_002731 [Candida oxycetoniae]